MSTVAHRVVNGLGRPAAVPSRPPFAASVDQAPTLAAVLAEMGHACQGPCPAEAQGLKAVWHVPRGGVVGSVGLVVVDIADDDQSADDLTQIIADVNRCVQRDRIRVRLKPH